MIRLARLDDLAHLPGVERAGGEAFRLLGMGAIADDEPAGTDVLEGYRRDERAWVAVDGDAHVEQVTVHPASGGRRLGAALLDVAQAWSVEHASGALTLTTFTHVPWNAPYYRRLGFADVRDEDLTPGLRAVVAHEAAAGLDTWPRVVMRRASGVTSPPALDAR